MGLPASDAKFDGNVANVVLNELRQGLHFFERSVCRSRQRDYLLFDFRGSGVAPVG